MSTLLALTLAFSQQASAGDLSLDISRGSITPHNEANWGLYSDSYRLSGWGLRGGYAVNSWLTGVVGWQYAEDGGTVEVEDGSTGFHHALVTNQITLGPKFSLDVLSWLQPYATVQGVAMLGRARLDDDIYDDENLNELRASGLAPGGLAAGGVDVITRRVDKAVRPTLHVEVGYAYLAPLELDAMGQLEIHGLYTQWGVGARF